MKTKKIPEEGQILLDRLSARIDDVVREIWMDEPTPEIVDSVERLKIEFHEMYFQLWDVATDAKTIRRGRSEGGTQAETARQAKSEAAREMHKKMRAYAESLRGKHPPHEIRSLVAKKFERCYETARRIVPV